MSGLRNRRVVDRDAEATDLFSSSMIFGNAGAGPAAQQQSFATSPYSAGAPYLLDGSGGSRRSPGGSLRQSPGQSYSEHSRGNQSSPLGGGRATRTSRPPITSLLEKKSRGGLAPGRTMDLDSQRTPRTNMMDRTHMSMSVANTPYHSEAEGALGDISYVSDGGVFGSYTGGYNVDSGGGRRLPPGRMQTPFSRKSRLGYADEDEDEDGDGDGEYQGMDMRNASAAASTPVWGRDNQSASAASSGEGGRYGRMQGFEESRSDRHSQQSNRMVFGTSFDGSSRFESEESRDVFDQLDAAWLVWVVVSGVPLGASSSSSASSVSKVLMRMQAFGTVMEHSLSSGNWMFIKFSTPYEAGRAVAEPVTFLGSGLDSHVMLSCTQLSSALARSLNLHIDDAGALTQGSGLCKGLISSPFPSSRHNDSQSRPDRPLGAGLELRSSYSAARDGTVGTEMYLRPPKKREGNICSRLIEYIFSY